MEPQDACCEKLWDNVKPRGNIVIENSDGTLDVEGCCGGGCNVLEGIKFCPFCGKEQT